MPVPEPLTSFALLRGLCAGAPEHGNRDVPERPRELGGVESRARRRPILRGKLEDAIRRPAREDTKDVAEVVLGIERVELRGSDEREPRARDERVGFRSEKEPIVTAYSDMPDLKLGEVIRNRDMPIVEKSTERLPVIDTVIKRLPQRASRIDIEKTERACAPCREFVENRFAARASPIASFGGAEMFEFALERKELIGKVQTYERALIGRGGIKETAPAMAPTSDRPSLGKGNEDVAV